jgi:hypothetical protein
LLDGSPNGSTACSRTRVALLRALGYFADPALIARAHDVLSSNEFDRFEAGSIIQAQLDSPDGARAANAYLRTNWDTIMAGMPPLVGPFILRFSEALCDAGSRAEVEAFFTPRVDQMSDGAQTLAEVLAEIDGCIARRAALGAGVAKVIGAK